ncbi:MAG: IS982 family transposase [Candidatus Competibacteraceae bacterium]|nr:IS982 family transposase [Candidatus Competibacteraceae bacterium]
MPLEEFIIMAFCWVETAFEDVTAGIKLRTRGFAPRLSDSEVITMEIVGEVLGHDGDEAIWEYFRRHWAAWFPGLGDRSTFVRQAANLWWVKQLLHERLVVDVGARTADGHIIDGFPIAVCKLARAVRSQVLKAEAGYGYCAAKREYYYGLKAHLLIDLRGVAVGVTVTAANVDERDAAYDVLSAIEGLVLGDKSYIRPRFKADCEALGIDLQTPVRRNMKEPRPRWWLTLLQRVRKRIETVISQLEQRFNLAKTRTRDVWHLTNQVTRKLLAHTMSVWLNLRLGREPLDLDGLLVA